MKKSLSIILSIVLVITSTFCLGFSAFADNSINYDESSKTLTLTGFKVLTSENIESFENKSDVVRINLKSDIEEVGASVFDDFASLQKLVVYNPDCQFNTVGALPKGSSATIYSYPSSKVQEHAENHGFNFKKIYKLSFVQKDSTGNQEVITVVDALEDDTPQDIAKMAPEFTNKEILHYKDGKGKDKHVCQVWDPAIVTPTSDALYTEKTRSFYCEDYKGTRVTKVSTCQNEGEGEIYCTVCKYVFDKYTIDKAQHKYASKTVISPTCTEVGYTTEKCSVCGYEYKSDYVNPTGHTEVIDKEIEPTCEETGLTEGVHCSACGKVIIKQNVVNALGHNTQLKNQKDSTCSAEGYTGDEVCMRCGKIVETGKTTEKSAHEYEAITVEPTCVSIGYTTYSCKNCDATYNDDFKPIVSHEYNTVVIKPTCTSFGYTINICKVCGKTEKVDYVNSLGHNFGDNLPNCIVCGEKNPDYLPPINTQPTTGPSTSADSEPTTVPATAPITSTTESTTAVSKPKSTKIKKATGSKKAVAITWAKISGVKGYEVQIATDKKFKKNKKTVTIKKQKTTKTTFKKLKSKAKYYIRIRTYKTVNGKKVYSSWSKVKTVKTK